MEEKRKMKKSTKYLLIGTLVLFLSILGASVAYYLARVSGNLSGRAAGTELELTITPLSTSATGDLIPLDNDLETLGLAAKGYGNEGSTFDSTKSCIDINGYSVCQIYRVRVTNNGSVPLTMNGTVTLYGQDTPNIDCAKMDDEVTVTNNNSCMGTNTLANNVTLPANNHLDYYVMVYIKNLDEPQYDKGEFNGTVVFTSTQGNRVKGRFKPGENLVEHITDLYNSAEKTIVHHSTYVLDDNSSSASGVNNTNKKANSMLLAQSSGSGSGGGGKEPEPIKPVPVTPGTPSTIDYHYATSVGLMNDRLGGTTESLDGGNIRYYGETPNNYIDIGDKYEEDVTETKKNWSKWGSVRFCPGGCTYKKPVWWSQPAPTSDDECKEIITNNGGWTENDAGYTGYSTIEEFCSSTTEIVAEKDTPILWRIIGVFDGKVRIVRDEPIGGYSYDTSSSDINSGNGINEWSQADLMKLLNPGFDSETVGGSLWWNNQSGYCYTSKGTIECNFTNTGLSDEAKEYVVDQTIYLGGFDFDDQAAFANQAYQLERGTKVIQNPSDGVTRTLSWTVKVGLPYPSDYGYAADLSNCSENLYSYNKRICDNWLDISDLTISPRIDLPSVTMFVRGSRNRVFSEVLPVLALSSDTYIISGTGTSKDPYIVG